MRNVIYKCDLCKEEKPHPQVYTLFWDSTLRPAGYKLLVTKPDDNYDKQICTLCVQMIKHINLPNE